MKKNHVNPSFTQLQKTGVIYLGCDINDSTTFKRCRAFEQSGFDVLSFTYDRAQAPLLDLPTWTNVDFGPLENGLGLHRLIGFVTSARLFLRHRKAIRQASFIYARNLDQAILAILGRWLSLSRAPLVYEVLDLHPLVLSPGKKGRVARWLERFVLRRASHLVIGSDGFVERFFKPHYGDLPQTFLLENKIMLVNEDLKTALSNETRKALIPPSADGPWVIGFVGLLECETSVDTLLQLAERMPDQVRIRLVGKTENISAPLKSRAEDLANVELRGRYDYPQGLAQAYEGLHFNWCLNFRSDDNENNRLLLPNRYYEGGFFGVPVLVQKDTWMATRCLSDQVGWEMDDDLLESLCRLIDTLSRDEYRQKSEVLAAMPIESFVDIHDHKDLCEAICQIDPGSNQTKGQA